MTKKRMVIFLILLLVMIMSIGAISAVDTNDVLLENVSDKDIATDSVALEQDDNATLLGSDVGDEVEEINVGDSRNENHKLGVASDSNENLLKHSSNNFLYGGEWYYDLKDAWSKAEKNGGGTIRVWTGYYKYTDDSDDFEYKVNTVGSITLEPYGNGPVVFDGGESGWFLRVTNANVKVTINDITFKNLKGRDGGAIEVEDSAQLTLNRCIFEGNHASSDGASYGLGGAIVVDEGSLIANNCRFINNKADRHGGAICIEDGGSVTLSGCYFEGNKVGSNANDFEDYSIDSGKTADWSLNDCQFKGSGSIEINVDYSHKSVAITPDVSDDVNYAVLYKDGSFYDRTACNDGDTAVFSDLERGTYTVYMMKNWERRYEYSGTTFTIIEPYFVLNDEKVFETLSAAVNAISSGGSGVITVEGGTYTESANFNVQIRNKAVTIRPKDSSHPVTFSSNSQNYLFDVGSNSKLTMEDITVKGKFSGTALTFNTNQECTISDCEFKNIQNAQNQPGNPINARNSNLVLNGNTFESNSKIILENTVANIDDCTFTYNHGIDGGAIYADSSSDVTVTNSNFNMNGANNKGGAIYAANLKVQDTTFVGNTAKLGGAVYIAGSSNNLINITHCVFDSNVATAGYRNIYSESLTRKINLEYNEYDVGLKIDAKDGAYGMEYVLDGDFDWGSNLNSDYVLLAGIRDDDIVFGGLLNVEDNKFKISMGVLSGGTHEFTMAGMFSQGDSADHFYGHSYYADLKGNEFYLNKEAYAKIVIEKARITLNLVVDNVLIPETPVLNVYANWDNNYTILIGNKNYQLEVVNGKGSMPLTGLDLGNYTVVGMRDGDENYYMAMNFTTFSISKTYSNFLVLSTNVEYDTLAEAVANSNSEDIIHIKKGTYKDTGVVISDRSLSIIALDGAVFDAQGRDGNFITVNQNAVVDICGVTFRGLHNRNTNYGAIVNHGYLSLDSCNFTDNKITKTAFSENGGAAVFSDGYSLAIENCNFINNVAPLKVSTAAVTSLGYDEVSITDSKFINNTAREGGALHFKNITQFEAAISSCDFEQNTAVKGSAIYVGNNSRYLALTLSDFKKNDIKNNLGENAQLEGGVIYVNADDSDVTLDISLSNFEDNSNSNVDGGVLCLDGSSKAAIESCTFNNNNGKVGSAILIKNPYNKKLSLLIDSSAFTNNNAATGAIATSPKVTTFIDECAFANNTGENRNIYSNGFTVVHDSIFDVKDVKLNAPSVQYGESSIIGGTADIGANVYAAANLTVAGKNVLAEIKNNTFTYNAGVLDHGKYYAVLNSISDNNGNTYLMDGITEIFRVYNNGFDLNVSVDNITYGETLKVTETLPSNATGAIDYQLNGRYYTKDEIESLILDAGKYTLVAIYDNDDFALTSSTVNFEVYKANPTISVADVEVEYNDTIVINIETNVPSIYTIEIGDYKTVVFVNGSRSVEIEKIFNPGTYTIKVTSQERVNYISNSTEAVLKVLGTVDARKDNSLESMTLPSTAKSSMDGTISIVESAKSNANSVNAPNSPDNNLGDEYDEYKFIFQYDEDSDPEYYETLEDAIDEAVTWGAGIITVRGGRYSGYGFCGFELEGELELTIKAYEGEEVIFDCENENQFMHLSYETIVEPTTTPPFFETYQTEGPTVTLDHITVINGYSDGDGGAIEMDAGTLILANCTFLNNNADCGGVIYIGSVSADEGATVIGYNTTFMNNYASEEGGVVFMQSPLQDLYASFNLCTFLYNYQGEGEERTMNYYAGSAADEIESKYCMFNANGIIYSVDIDKIDQIVTVNGTTTDPFDSVVLLYFDQVPLYTINNNGSQDFYVTFEDVMGGNYTVGIMNDHDFNTYIFENRFEMIVPNFIISEDEVYENLTDAIDAVSENGIIYANMNYYTEDNMEIDIGKSFTLKNFRGRVVVFDGCSEKWFFTIAEGNTVVFDGIYFTDGAVKNHASIENYGTLILNNCSFDNFETGEIVHNSGLLNILNSTFSLNSVNNALVWNDNELYIETVEFSYNIVNTSSAVYTNGVAEIVSSNFTGNYNFGNGGAIYNAKSLIVNGTVFSENEGMDGGAIYSTGTLTVLNSTFEDNTANGYGGAIFNGNEANIFNSTFTGGFSNKDGGAIYNNNMLVVDNSTFVANTATGRGGAIYNNKSAVITKSLFGINFAEEYANIYNEGDIQFRENIFDFYDVILYIPDGQYGIPTTITGTLNPEFNMDLQVNLPGFVNSKDAPVTISDGLFEYVTDILPKGVYDVVLNEIIYDGYGNIYYGESIRDRLVINKANVYINVTVDDVVIRGETGSPVLKIDTSKTGTFHILFNNRLYAVEITDKHSSITLDAVGEGNYSVTVVREGDENYNDAANTTAFKVSKYEGKFIVNSTGNQFETLREALADSSNDDVIYVREGTYSGADNLGLTISDKKLSIISLGDVVFDGNSSGLNFLTVDKNADVTIYDVVVTGFNTGSWEGIISNKGNLTVDGGIFTNNTLVNSYGKSVIKSTNNGNLNIVGSGFYDNYLEAAFLIDSVGSSIIVNGSTFENNTVKRQDMIYMSADSAKIISNVFAENKMTREFSIINAYKSDDVLISSEFYNNALDGQIIYVSFNDNLLVNNSIFTGNKASQIIYSGYKDQITISGSLFTDNTVENVVLSKDVNISVLESTFSDNTLSGKGALNIASGVNATVNGCVFTNNKADKYRNIYSEGTVDVSNSVFDALNVDYTVRDIDYGENETIEGTIDIGTNFNFIVNLDINSNSYSVNVTDSKFTYNAGILNGGDYKVVLNGKDSNSNTYLFNKITKIFTVSRIDPGLSVSVADITQGEKLKVNSTISKNVSANVVYELNGKTYTKKQLENLTLAPGNYLVVAMYRGDKNYLPATAMDNVKVHKVAPNITVSDVAVNYGDEIKINVSVDVADYYTVFLGNDSVSLYVNDNATFTFPSEGFKPDNYEIIVYVFETDDYAEAYGYATLTVNKAVGVFNLTNDIIVHGENATINVTVPLNAYGNIAYEVYDAENKLVYNTTQSCLEELVVPNLSAGSYVVTGTFKGDSYYNNESIINSGEIFVRECIDVNIAVSNITYGENATVTVESTVDGEYLVYVGTEPMLVTVVNGAGNVSVSNLGAGSYVANVTIVDGNYSAFNETVFDVAPKPVSVSVSVEDIVYGEDAIVNVYGEIDGKYIVGIYDQNYTVNVAGGKGSIPIYNLVAANDILVSVTIADSNYSAHNTTTFTVVPRYDTPIELDIVTGEYNVTMTVTVNDTATGLVKFQVKGTEESTVYVDVIDGKAVFEELLDIGDYTVIATYMGDNRFNTNITFDDFTIRGHIKKDTPITANADVNGKMVTITVSVDENATGFVRLAVGDTVANIELADGIATITAAFLPNSYFVDVTYLGDDNYNMNSTKLTFTVIEISKENTTIDINIAVDEDSVMFDVDLNETATGLVKFYVACKETGENYTMYRDVKDGHSELFISGISPGNYTVAATYMGDSVFNTNITSNDFEVIGHIMKDTPIYANVETNLNKVTLTVKVDENATGFVEVKFGDGVLNIALENGEGTFTTEVPYGSYSLDITYLGDENYNKNSTKCDFTIVEPDKETTPIYLDIVTGENDVTMTVAVNDAATGLVKFEVTGTEEYVVYADVVNGKAVLEDVLDTGDYTVIVTYMGDGRFNTNITYEEFTIKGHIKKDTPINARADVSGNRVTLTVSVDENATGFVKLDVGGMVANVEVVDGVAKISSTFAANSYFVDVTYLGDDNYNANSTKLTFTVTDVTKMKTPIDLSIMVDENIAVFDVDLNETATGLVKFYVICKETGENATMYMDVKDGHVEVVTNSIEPGNYTVVATYMGDSVFNSNIIAKDFEVIGHIMKDTPIEATVETNLNKVTLTVKVDENATGFVEVKFGDGVLNIALENGEGTFITEVPYGSYSLDITYLGDENYNKNSTKCEFTIVEPDKETTPIYLDIVTGENDVVMTVTVNDAATGLVKFQVTGTEESVVYIDVVNGKAILAGVLDTGDYTVFATYMGDNRFNTNVTHEEFTINGHIKKDTPITANADVNGNRVTLTVTVDENATGFVKLSVGDTVANVELVDGVATLTSTFMANSYFVDVTYLGDDDYNMNSTKLTFTVVDVSKENTTIDLNIMVDENIAVFDVDLNKSATGLVKFYVICKETGENATMYMDVKDGHVELYTNSIEPGNYTVVATYMGDSVFNTNIIAKDFEIIGHIMKDTPISADVVSVNKDVTITANVDSNASGLIEFNIDGKVVYIPVNNGTAVYTTNLPAGNYNVDVTYVGDSNFNANKTSKAFNVTYYMVIDAVYDSSSKQIIATLTNNATGKNIQNANVKVDINGEVTTVKSNGDGKVIVSVADLPCGEYTAVISYPGNSKYNPAGTSIDFSTKEDMVVSAVYDSVNKQIIATLTNNATGKSIQNANVNVDINGEVITVKSNGDGKVIVSVADLPCGEYTAVISYPGNSKYDPAGTSIDFSNKDDMVISAVYDAVNKQIIATLTNNATGKSIQNANVNVDINGEVFTVKSNGDGKVIVSVVDLPYGEYTAMISYLGNSKYNPAATSIDFSTKNYMVISAGYDAVNKQIVGTLVNTDTGKVIQNANVVVYLNGEIFTVISNGNGKVIVSVDDLPSGDYIALISYLGNSKYNPTGTIIDFSIKTDMVISAVYDGANNQIVGTLVNKDTGKNIVNANVNVEINGETITVKSNGNGQVFVSVADLPSGDYSAVISYPGNGKYNPASAGIDFSTKNDM